MPYSHTNSKGQTFFLRQGVTQTDKARYFFSKTVAPDALEQIPAGYHIEESVNGVVSLVKDRKQLILPEEIRVIEAALHRHPKVNNYRASAKGKQITVYERLGLDAEDMANIFGKTLPMYSRQELLEGMQAMLDWLQDVVELADALGLERFAVLGFSAGGPYALACAIQIPRRLTKVGLADSAPPRWISRKSAPSPHSRCA